MEKFLKTCWESLEAFCSFLYRVFIESGKLDRFYDWACDHVIATAILLVLIAIALFWFPKSAKNIGIIAFSAFAAFCALNYYFEPHDESFNVFILAILVASGFGIFFGVYRLKRMF